MWNLIKRAPNSVLVIAGILICVLLLCVTAIIISGKSPSTLFSLINTIFSGLAVLSGAGAFTVAATAAKNAVDAKENTDVVVKQTNGELTSRVNDAVTAALEAHGIHPVEK